MLFLIWEGVVLEPERSYRIRKQRELHARFVALVQEIPNVNSACRLAYKDNPWSGRAPTATGYMLSLVRTIRRFENGLLLVQFPDCEIEIVESEQQIGKEGAHVQS